MTSARFITAGLILSAGIAGFQLGNSAGYSTGFDDGRMHEFQNFCGGFVIAYASEAMCERVASAFWMDDRITDLTN